MESNLQFSVLMCVYAGDNPEHFDAALNSIINQTTIPTEIVLTVDGPIPESIQQVINKYLAEMPKKSIEFKVVKLEKNMGHGEARRTCFNNCSYSIIAIMDADDISITYRFEKEIMRFEEDPELAIVGSHVSEFHDNPAQIFSKRIVKLTDESIKKDMRYRCPMNQPTVMFKKDAVSFVGGYVDWYCNEDYYLWIRLAQAGYKFSNIDDCLVSMRVDEKSYQRRGGAKYYKSEIGIQKYMLEKNMIGYRTYLVNCLKRLIVERLLHNKLRSWVYRQFARD